MMDRKYIFVLNMLQELQFTVGSFSENGCAKRFHYLLYGNRCAS